MFEDESLEESSEDPPVKSGIDWDLERQADEWLSKGVKDRPKTKHGKRARDVEKMMFESGLISADELKNYDPTNDWDVQDGPTIALTSPGDIVNFSSSVCAEVDDGNVRARNPRLSKRQALMLRIDDEDGWGSAREEQPLPPLEIGERKVCTRCGRSKGVGCFSPKMDAKDKLHPWCKPCRKEAVSQKRGDSK